MANRLQLRRGTGAPGGVFHEGEPVYDKSGKVLYVGDDGASGSGNGSAVASASAYSSVVEILNQASSTSAAFIKLLEDSDNGNHNVSLKAPAAIASNYSLVLPDGTGSANQILKTDGAGNLDWVDQNVGYTGFSITDGTNTESVDSGNTVTFTGGDGITAAVSSTDTLTISADLKANGGVVIESSELAVDLGASSITGTLAVSDGGTGATSASAARTALGLAIGSDVQAYDAQLADVAGLTPSDGGIIIGDGSNFVVESGATARTSLGVDAAGTDNSTNVTLVTTSHDYLSISGQAITLGPIDLAADVTGDLPVAEGGTGASNASDARTNLGLAIGSDVQAYDAQLADVAGLTPSDGGFIVGDGSNFVVESAATARTSLGVDAAGTDNSTNVTLSGSPTYITISGQEITRNAINLATDVTGSLPNANLANSSITVSDGSNSTARALGDTLTIQGTANEVTVTESSGTVTVALPDNVTIGNDLTVNGNLNVVGTAVTFSAETTRIEDRILELGLVNGAAPSSATTWDLGVAFNYNNSGAKKAGVVWLNNGFMAMLSELAESSDTGNADPQITATAYAPIAAGGLYLGGVASGNHIINSSGEAQNLVFDGGSY
jgi:hypothetical protein